VQRGLDGQCAGFVGGCRTAEAGVLFDDSDLAPVLRQDRACGQTAQACPDNGDIIIRLHHDGPPLSPENGKTGLSAVAQADIPRVCRKPRGAAASMMRAASPALSQRCNLPTLRKAQLGQRAPLNGPADGN